MKKITVVLAASALMFSALTMTGQASTMKKHMMAKSMVCPYCHMKMMTVKSAGAPVPVKIKGVTYYCCSTCHPSHMTKKKTM